MPVVHDSHGSSSRRPSSRPVSSFGLARVALSPRASDGQNVQSWHVEPAPPTATAAENQPEAPGNSTKPTTLDRRGLIDRLKRAKSPTWLPPCGDDPRPSSRDRPQSPLLPPGDSRTAPITQSETLQGPEAAGTTIERPRSALHAGDFSAHKEGGVAGSRVSPPGLLATSPVAPWHKSFPATANSSTRKEAPIPFRYAPSHEPRAVSRARATSQSSPSSFEFLPPTSPLVHQANNTDLDFSSRPASRQSSNSPERSNRRHTFSPASFHGYRSTEIARSVTGTPAARHLRRGSSIPYQAHQPRRSLRINQVQSQSNSSTPFPGRRRPSLSTDVSPLQHAPMVGSYEESILRGRMSTIPSRPLDFVAKIGVLGRGNCKSSLKCPPHVTIPFPAVFYSYNTGNGKMADNEPSPYVGLIDLEHCLPQPTQNPGPVKRTRRHAAPDPRKVDLEFGVQVGEELSGQGVKQDARRMEKTKRRSASPRAPPGGSYRIPGQGQLQIVLKNPNNTAVKLFLVPYDISDMEPGQKTFIRQRSYSAGPIIDMPTSSRRNLGTDRPEAALSHSDDPNDRPILRYLIHLHICCPAKGRYYLYKSIRVVFANRVPDGKEKLRNEIQLAEPRYSVYKPTRDANRSQTALAVGGQVTTDKAFRRRSAGWPLSHSQQGYDRRSGLQPSQPLPPDSPLCPINVSASMDFGSAMPDIQPIPFSLSRLAAIESRPVSRERMDLDAHGPTRTSTGSPGSPLGQLDGGFEKLSKGDVGYGGNAFSPASSPATPLSTGLLSRRLRGLDVQHEAEREES